MRFLLEPEATTDLPALCEAAIAAEQAGLDGIMIAQSGELSAPLLAAAAIAPEAPELWIAVEVELGERHPFEIAEEAAVVDLVSGGRLVLVTRAAERAKDAYPEALELLRRALVAAPLRFQGERWQVPANLPQNVHTIDTQVRMMPSPAQPRLEVWASGGAPTQALRHGIGYLAGQDEDAHALGEAYRRAADALGPALIGAIRARRETLDEAQALTRRLRAGREAFGQDCAVVAGDAATAHELAQHVSPNLQLNRLPEGLEDFWLASREQSTEKPTSTG